MEDPFVLLYYHPGSTMKQECNLFIYLFIYCTNEKKQCAEAARLFFIQWY